MGIRLPRNKKVTIKDFTEDDIGKFRYAVKDWEIVFYETSGAYAKMYIEVWYLEGNKRYRREQITVDRRIRLNKTAVRESNRRIWHMINSFSKKYCHEGA